MPCNVKELEHCLETIPKNWHFRDRILSNHYVIYCVCCGKSMAWETFWDGLHVGY